MPEREVAITGIGPVTPIGTGVDDFWKAALSGKSGAGPLTRFPVDEYASRISAEINDFDIGEYLEPKRARRHERFSQFAYAGTVLALRDAQLEPTDPDPARTGIIVGTGIGGIWLFEQEHTRMMEKGPRVVSPSLIAMMIPNAAAGLLAIELGYTGPNECTVTACASGGHAIARAVDIIRNGQADVMLAGGSESAITPLSLASFCSARALSRRNDDPERASRPFDAERDGFVFGEGSTMLVLESMEHAKARGARIRGRILGYGLSSDAHHIVAPHPEGAGAAAAMIAALKDSDIAPDQVGYINAHATSTERGDESEVKAIKTVFGNDPPPASAPKSMTGHLLGAAGSTELAMSVLAIEDQTLPPTINYEYPDPECDIDCVPNKAREHNFEIAISNSFGFGGHNASIVVAKP